MANGRLWPGRQRRQRRARRQRIKSEGCSMEQFFPEMIMGALKDAVIKVFWKKEDMRALLQKCKVPSLLINDQDWTRFKFHIISPVIDALNVDSTGLGPLRRVLNETLSYSDCS